MQKIKGILLDADYENSNGLSVIRAFVRTKNGIEVFSDASFRPYFFAKTENLQKAKKAIEEMELEEGAKAHSVEVVEKDNEKVLKLEFKKVEDLLKAREKIKELEMSIERFEYDIPFANRYLTDKQLQPMNGIEISLENNQIKSAKSFAAEKEFSLLCFDIEAHAPGRMPDPKEDPLYMIAVASTGKKTRVLTYKKIKQDFVETLPGEKEVIEEFCETMKKTVPDIVVTYNGDSFDFPYLRERAHALKTKIPISSDASEPKSKKKGIDSAARLKGIQHLDAYQMLRLLSRFNVVNLIKFDLESVVESLWGKKKDKVTVAEMNRAWRTGEGLERLASYNREDAEETLKLAETYLPLLVEISKLVRRTIFDVSRASASILVEDLLVNKSFAENKLVRQRPKESETKQRMTQSFAGGYVKEPVPGLHENIAVLDFSSLHPTIMISHNVSPENLDCPHKECRKNLSPNNHWFCTKQAGFLSSAIKELFETRMEIKKKLKTMDKKNNDYLLLNARSQAIKIILNSFYGYLGYARSRWYSIEAASAVTAWSRNYVQWVGKKAEEAGFKLLYEDTDSAFLLIPKGKTQEDVIKLYEKMNSELPGVMRLDLEGFYKRGIFVTKETGQGAKKKYALIDYKNNLKIVGFEYVRRDWSWIAKETQMLAIKAILEEGKPEKAVEIVKKKIQLLKEGKVPKKDLVILTQVKRKLSDYESIGPHVAAAQKAVKRGKELGTGSVIGFIITRTGKSISDKAELEEYVKEGNYDADYYIEHQVIPAVYKVIRELGYSKEDLIHGGKQKTLGSF